MQILVPPPECRVPPQGCHAAESRGATLSGQVRPLGPTGGLAGLDRALGLHRQATDPNDDDDRAERARTG